MLFNLQAQYCLHEAAFHFAEADSAFPRQAQFLHRCLSLAIRLLMAYVSVSICLSLIASRHNQLGSMHLHISTLA